MVQKILAKMLVNAVLNKKVQNTAKKVITDPKVKEALKKKAKKEGKKLIEKAISGASSKPQQEQTPLEPDLTQMMKSVAKTALKKAKEHKNKIESSQSTSHDQSQSFSSYQTPLPKTETQSEHQPVTKGLDPLIQKGFEKLNEQIVTNQPFETISATLAELNTKFANSNPTPAQIDLYNQNMQKTMENYSKVITKESLSVDKIIQSVKELSNNATNLIKQKEITSEHKNAVIGELKKDALEIKKNINKAEIPEVSKKELNDTVDLILKHKLEPAKLKKHDFGKMTTTSTGLEVAKKNLLKMDKKMKQNPNIQKIKPTAAVLAKKAAATARKTRNKTRTF